jgi:hypothetical protein
MGRTGVVWERLSDDTCRTLLARLLQMLRGGHFAGVATTTEADVGCVADTRAQITCCRGWRQQSKVGKSPCWYVVRRAGAFAWPDRDE